MPDIQQAILEAMQQSVQMLSDALRAEFGISLTARSSITPLLRRGRSWQAPPQPPQPPQAASTEEP